MTAALSPWIADLLVILGVAVLGVAVYGMVWMSDPYTRLHAASKAVFPGLVLLLSAAATTGEFAIICRVILIGAFLLFTAPVAAHAIAAALYRQGQPQAKEPVHPSARTPCLPPHQEEPAQPDLPDAPARDPEASP